MMKPHNHSALDAHRKFKERLGHWGGRHGRRARGGGREGEGEAKEQEGEEEGEVQEEGEVHHHCISLIYQ